MQNLTPQQLRKLKKLADILDKGNIAVLEHMFEIEEELDAKLAKIESSIPDVSTLLQSIRGVDGKDGMDGKDGKDGDRGEKGERGAPGRDGKDGKDGKNGRDGKNGMDGKDGKDGKDGAPSAIDEATIGYLENEIQSLREDLKKKPGTVINGGIIGRNLIQDYDLSPYLDGVTRTFNIPGTWNIISVDTSSFPHALRKNIDYTYTQQTITFTSQVDAATTLAAGQTVVLTIISA